MKVLALIPARGGSKGIVRKNLADLAGKPLIAWTILPAVACQAEGTLTRVVVSTDDPEIAEVSAGHGAEVPFLRPAALADDTAKTVDVVMHALDFFAATGEVFDAVMLLQPTSPLRTQEDIRLTAELFADRKAESLISVSPEPQYNPLILYGRDGDFAVPLDSRHNQGVRRQDLPAFYVRNGAIYLTRTNYLRQNGLLISPQPLLYEMPRERSANIDAPADLEWVRCVLAK